MLMIVCALWYHLVCALWYRFVYALWYRLRPTDNYVALSRRQVPDGAGLTLCQL